MTLDIVKTAQLLRSIHNIDIILHKIQSFTVVTFVVSLLTSVYQMTLLSFLSPLLKKKITQSASVI